MRVIERTVIKTVETPEKSAGERNAPEASEEGNSEEQAPEDTLALQYEYINEGDYGSAYNLFAEQSRELVSFDEYKAFFENAGYYEITDYSFPIVQVGGETATMEGELYVSSGTNGDEQYSITQRLVRENGSWRVIMRDGQVATFTGTGGEPDPDIQQPEDANTKQVTVEISSDVPVDVSIYDDNFDVTTAEEIVGSETYEFEIAADSGLAVDAISETMSGNVSIAVYENGELVAEDNSSEGYAQVMY
ncbi:MAG: hypothetical protein ACFB50_02095 [Rubrobacteraceae bacterium]